MDREDIRKNICKIITGFDEIDYYNKAFCPRKLDELVDWHIFEIKKAERRARVEVAKEILSDTIQNIKHKDRNQRVIVHDKCQNIINQCQQGE